MEVGIAHEHEPGRRQGRRVHPGFQRGQFGVVEAVLLVLLLVQPGPAARARHRRLSIGLLQTDVLRVEIAQVVRGAVDVQRARARERREELRVRLVPAVADCRVVEHLDARAAIAHQQCLRQTERRQVLVVDDVVPVVAEIRRGERLTVRPLVAASQVEREHPTAFVDDLLQNVGNDAQLLVVADQPRIAIDDHHPDVAVLRHQHAHLASVNPLRPVRSLQVHDQRRIRQAVCERRKLAGGNVWLQHRRFFRTGLARQHQRDNDRAGEPGGARDHAINL